MKRKRIAVLGSTGSIGESTFKVLTQFPERFEAALLTGNNNIRRLAEQAAILKAKRIATANPALKSALAAIAPPGTEVIAGMDAVTECCASDAVDTLLCAIVGTGGLMPTLAALKSGKNVALASKEVMVMAGEIVNRTLATSAGTLTPVDSEHSAIFQCLEGRSMAEVKQLLLTCSGGPFRTWPEERIAQAKASDALAHPVWSMGTKITIDSASLMNKALEMVEARFLFRAAPEQIGVVIHPESIVHSLVEFRDGAMLAQMSVPDMRFAIQYALSRPERWEGGLPELRLPLHKLTFEEPDEKRFPALAIARRVLAAGGCAPAVMNAANEVAVAAFLQERIPFPMITGTVEDTLDASPAAPQESLEQVVEADREARIRAEEFIRKHS